MSFGESKALLNLKNDIEKIDEEQFRQYKILYSEFCDKFDIWGYITTFHKYFEMTFAKFVKKIKHCGEFFYEFIDRRTKIDCYLAHLIRSKYDYKKTVRIATFPHENTFQAVYLIIFEDDSWKWLHYKPEYKECWIPWNRIPTTVPIKAEPDFKQKMFEVNSEFSIFL